MTLRLRLCVVAGLLLAVLAAAGFLLVQTVEASQIQQLDQQLEASAPLSLVLSRPGPGPSPKIKPPRPLTSENAVSDIFVATISHGHRHVALAPLWPGPQHRERPRWSPPSTRGGCDHRRWALCPDRNGGALC